MSPNPNLRALPVLTDRTEDFRSDLPTEPRLEHRDPGGLGTLFGLRAADDLIADHGLRYPLFTMSRDGARLPAGKYTPIQRTPGSITRDMADLPAVHSRMAAGSTLILEHLHRTWRPIGDFCRRLGYELGRPIGANSYLTPPGAQGFGVHYDTHGAFILQIEGSKVWELHEPITPFPLEDQRWREEMLSAADREALREKGPVARYELVAGDVLWVPRGWLHEVFTTETASLHVTLSVPELSKHWLATKVFESLAQDEEFRRDLPLDALATPQRAREESELVLKSFAAWLLRQDPAELADRAMQVLDTIWYPSRSTPVTTALYSDEQLSSAQAVETVREAVRGFSYTDDGRLALRSSGGEVLIDSSAAGYVGGLLAADDASLMPVAQYLDGLGPDAHKTLRVLLATGVAQLHW